MKTSTIKESSWETRALQAEAKLNNALIEMEYLKGQLRLLQAKRFGSSSEKTKMLIDQLTLFDNVFNEAEATAEPFAPEPELVTVPEHKRKKQRAKKGEFLGDLPEEIIEYHLPEEDMVCSCCGHLRHVINEEITKEAVVVPARLFARVHKRKIYSCRACEVNGDGLRPIIVKAPKPNRAFPGSIASPSVVAHVIDEKYVMGSPLYRQEQQWARRGINITRQNMANWVNHAADSWLISIYERMKDVLLAQDIILADETTLQVLKEPGKAPESKSYMWLYRSGRYGPGIAIFEYQPSRAKEHPAKFLQGYKGFLQTDAYPGYDGLPGVINVGCLAHARRKFDEAIKVAGGKGKYPKAQEGVDFCNKLYAIEHKIEDKEPHERYQERLRNSKPILEAFSAWLHTAEKEVLGTSHLGKAIQYCLNHWASLNAYLLDGRLEIDNNRSERSIKPFVIGRKNFLFADTPRGARASAIIYSIVESAKENELIPYEYIQYLLEELPNASTSELDKFLPWSNQLPEHCYTPKKK